MRSCATAPHPSDASRRPSGFEAHVLAPGDSICFESTVPHRLETVGDEPAKAIWFVVGRDGGNLST
jgi:hypothetical protein